MYDLVQYGAQHTFQFVMVKRNVVDFAVSADWTPAAGDVKISIDGGNDANTTNLPAAVSGTSGLWALTLTSGELTGKQIGVRIMDSATKAVEDNAFFFKTFGHADAAIVRDVSVDMSKADIRQIAGTAIGTPATAGYLPVTLKPGTGTGEVALASGAVTVGTNNDKTGYGLSAAAVQAIWDALLSALTAVGSVGKKLADLVLGSDSKVILSNNAHTGATIPTVTAVTNPVITGTNNDKTGYRLSATGVDDILDEAITEPSGVFAWGAATLRNIMGWLGAVASNKYTETADTATLRTRADTATVASAPTSDDGTTGTRGSFV